MTAPIGLQRYTLRKALAEDFEGVVKQVADIGYVGFQSSIESFGPQSQEAQFFRSLGLRSPAPHIKLPIAEDLKPALDNAAAADAQYVVVSMLPAAEFQSIAKIQQAAEWLNEADMLVRQHGLTLAYHNHWWEFESVIEGRTAHAILRDYLSPTVMFELDVYWAQVGGSDPLQVLKELGTRAPLLHIKDGPAVKGQPMTAVGTGNVDIPGIIKASEGIAQWQIVELDECATDMLEAVRDSYTYLIGKGFARGNKG